MRKQKPDKAVAPQIRLESAGQVAVTYSAVPPKGSAAKVIHPRRALPEVAPAPTTAPSKK